jgi:hypothetical protein
MKIIRTLVIVSFIFISSFSNAEFKWTDNGDSKGKGLEVKSVYLQWDQHWVSFSDATGRDYYYYWGTEETPGHKGNIFFSTLLTAFTASKRVSIYVSQEPTHGNSWYEFTFINLHD